jgi:hypothetical protein
MSQLISTGTNPKALWPGIAYWWGQAYDEHEIEWQDLFDQETSGKAYEEVVESVGFGLPQVKPEGESITYDTTSQGVTTRFTHVAYALGMMVTHEEMRDNLYAAVGKRRSGDLAFSMRQGHEVVCADFYNNGFSANGADGVPWFSASHPTASGLQSNLLTSADLSEASLEDAVIQIMSATDSRGRKIPLRAMSLHVAPANWFEATRILKSVLQNDTAQNAINALKATGEFPKGIKVNHYFDDPDAYFIRTNARHGAIHFQRDPISFQEDGVFDTMASKYAAYERFSVGRADYRGAYGSPGA